MGLTKRNLTYSVTHTQKKTSINTHMGTVLDAIMGLAHCCMIMTLAHEPTRHVL